MTALRYFLIPREQKRFALNDFTLSHWPKLDETGVLWEDAKSKDAALPVPNLDGLLPSLDVWLDVEENEVHYVTKIIPTLEWGGGRLGIRLRLEPSDPQKLQTDYLAHGLMRRQYELQAHQRMESLRASQYGPVRLRNFWSSDSAHTSRLEHTCLI
jgi:hypothetical protein